MYLYLIPLMTTLTLVTAAAAVYQLRFRNRHVTDRLQRVVGASVGVVAETTFEEPGSPLLKPVAIVGWLLPGQINSEMLYWELARAGHRSQDARKIFAGIRIMTTVLLFGAGVGISWLFHLLRTEMMVVSIVSATIGYFLPMMILRAQQSRRQQEITLGLPDVLDLLVICVEAGQGLNAALLKVARECSLHASALSDELKTVNNEMLAGVTRTQALRNFALRTGVDDVRSFVAAMIQSDRFGTSIAQALRIYAASARTRRRQRAEETARKAPVKLVFPLVFCIFPALMVVILAPGMLQLLRALAASAQG